MRRSRGRSCLGVDQLAGYDRFRSIPQLCGKPGSRLVEHQLDQVRGVEVEDQRRCSPTRSEAADDKTLARTIARYGRVDLLMIDELGYMALDRRGAELLCQVLTEREEKNSVAIASNESFSGWTKTFTDPRLCAAIVDGLTFGGNIIKTGTDSYRLAHTRQQLRTG